MSAQTLAIIFAYLATAGAVLGTAITYRARRRMQAMTARLTHAMAGMEKHRAFVYWGTWTMLSVTAADGSIEARTLRQLYDQNTPDRVWDAPIAVSLWTAEPEVLDAFRAELDAEEQARRG